MKVDSVVQWFQNKDFQKNKMEEQREAKVEPKTSILDSSTEAPLVKSTLSPSCPFYPSPSETYNNYIYTRDKDPNGNGVPLKKDECCWTCRSFKLASLSYTASTLITKIRSELQNFRAALGQEYPELSATPFDFTLGSDGNIEIVKSDRLTPSDLAILTDAIRNYKPLSSVIKAHAELLLDYSSHFLDSDGASPLSYQTFSDRVKYATLLADTQNILDLFGNDKKTGEHYTSAGSVFAIDV